MKKAAFYARVSSDLQKKERTIESQIDALRKQIGDAGDVLVKEYIDDGWSGARLDRPALDELRKDLKTDLFETIYFLNTDRIAREVTYQTIIIAEILRNKKQIIINGKDYIHNPENKFALTVLGAVAELERAKITERSSRGRQRKLSEGVLMSGGGRTYGYNYIRKTPTSSAQMTINEKEAKIVRYVFEEYAKGNISMNRLSKKLEEKGVTTKTGKRLWGYSALQSLLKKPVYTGVKYFNQWRSVTEYANPISGTATSKKLVKRDRGEWVGIPVPAIISQELFDKAQERLAFNRKRYRSPMQTQLLSSLVKCGYCGTAFSAYRRFYIRERKIVPKRVYHHFAYRCGRHFWWNMHARKLGLKRCESREKTAHILEEQVFMIIENVMCDAAKLRNYMDIFKTKRPHPRMEKEIEKLNKEIESHSKKKYRITDLYAAGDLTKDEYVAKSRIFDKEISDLAERKSVLLLQLPLFRQTKVVDMGIQQYCDAVKSRYKQCTDFETKRQFLLDCVEKVTYLNDKITVHGRVPIIIAERDKKHSDDSRSYNVEFQIGMKIEYSTRWGNKWKIIL